MIEHIYILYNQLWIYLLVFKIKFKISNCQRMTNGISLPKWLKQSKKYKTCSLLYKYHYFISHNYEGTEDGIIKFKTFSLCRHIDPDIGSWTLELEIINSTLLVESFMEIRTMHSIYLPMQWTQRRSLS